MRVSLLQAEGFASGRILAGKTNSLLSLLTQQLSNQRHYDFGLRALRSALTRAGRLRRNELSQPSLSSSSSSSSSSSTGLDSSSIPLEGGNAGEQSSLIRALRESLLPKLTPADALLYDSLVCDAFGSASISADDGATSTATSSSTSHRLSHTQGYDTAGGATDSGTGGAGFPSSEPLDEEDGSHSQLHREGGGSQLASPPCSLDALSLYLGGGRPLDPLSTAVLAAAEAEALESGLVPSRPLLTKVMQLYATSGSRHATMLVGRSMTGKTAGEGEGCVWRARY